jgi:folate-binding protein YgfZ
MKNNYFVKNFFSKFIEIKGEDSNDFLQGLITNDIKKCVNDIPIYACLLTPQGRFISDFFIVCNDDSFIIEIHEKYYENFLNKLRMYKLRSKVEFSEKLDLFSYISLSKIILPKQKNIITFQDPRNSKLGNRFYADKKKLDKIFKENFDELSFDSYKEILMQNLIPNTVDDLVPNKSLLLENNFQNINAIDWDKGCYIGQEITARMKYRSLLKKKIYVLELIKGDINLNSIIIVNDINIGYVISQVDKYLLCMLKINLVEKKYINKEIIEINQSTQIKFL